jgi:hypothetical protein
MGRQRPAWYYERQAREATARENYFKNRTPPTEDTAIESRGAQTEVYYRSLIMMDGTDHLIYTAQVPVSTLNLVTAAEAGLKTTLAAGETSSRLRGSGVKPTRVHWYRGSTNPVRRSTAWGTKVARYYDDGAGQSHRSMPFSKATGVFNADDVKDAFNALFGPGGSKRNLLGTANGRAYLSWESASVSANT